MEIAFAWYTVLAVKLHMWDLPNISAAVITETTVLGRRL